MQNNTNENVKRIGQQVGIFMEKVFPSMLPNTALPAVEKVAEHIVYEILQDIKNDESLGEARYATVKRLAEYWGVKV